MSQKRATQFKCDACGKIEFFAEDDPQDAMGGKKWLRVEAHVTQCGPNGKSIAHTTTLAGHSHACSFVCALTILTRVRGDVEKASGS